MSNKTKIKQLIKEAKLPERSVMICLDQGLTGDFEALERQLEELGRQPDTSSLEGDPRTAIAQKMADLREQMAERSAEFRFRALPRSSYSALLKLHPPRAGDDTDRLNGFNLDSFFDALLRACIVAPELDAEDWTTLLGDGSEDFPGVLSSAQYDTMTNTVWSANRRDVDIPFSPAASRLLRIYSPE